MTRIAEAFHGGLARFLAASAVAYALAAWLTDAPDLILVLNGVAMSVAAGVCVAYAPVLGSAVTAREPTNGHYLGAGIWFVALSVFAMRAMSYVARDLGNPEIYNTDWLTATLYAAILGGLLHLWAPNAVAGRVPKRRWVTTGAVVGLGVFGAFLVAAAHQRIGTAPPVQLR